MFVFSPVDCPVISHSKEEEDERAAARDIAEFERNKHLTKPCNTLDGFNVGDLTLSASV